MKKTALALILILLALSACSNREQPNDDTITDAADTTAEVNKPTPGTGVDVLPDVPVEDDSVRFVSNAGELKLETLSFEADNCHTLQLDDERQLILLYDYQKDKDGNIERSAGNIPLCTNIRAVLFNLATGESEATLPIDGSDVPTGISYTDTGCILYTIVYDVSGIPATAAWELNLSAATLSLQPIRFTTDDARSRYLTSPDGTWTAYKQSLDADGDAQIVLRDKAGKETVILKNTMHAEANDTESVEGYNLVGFLDNDRLVYTINGWEWCKGWGIYHLTDGTKTEFRDGTGVSQVYGGVLYGVSIHYAHLTGIYRMQTDGSKIMLADESHTLSAPLMEASELFWFGMQDGRWLGIPYENGGASTGHLYIYDADMLSLIAEIENASAPLFLYGDTLYLISLE